MSTVQDVIEDCEAGDDGGGIALHDYASPAINWTLVQRCVTVDDGGGLYVHPVDGGGTCGYAGAGDERHASARLPSGEREGQA